MADEPDDRERKCCGQSCLKILLMIINTVFLLFGGLLVAVGVFALIGSDRFAQSSDILDNLPDLATTAGLNDTEPHDKKLTLNASVLSQDFAIAFLVIGAILLLLSIEGFLGVCGKERGAVILYAVCVAFMLLVQIVLVIAFFAGALEGPVKGRLRDMIEDKYKGFDEFDDESLLLNFLMIKLECCGVDDYEDFEKARKWNRMRTFTSDPDTEVTLLWPIACCEMDSKFEEFKNQSCLEEQDTGGDVPSNKDKGCYKELAKFLKDNYQTMAIISCAIVFAFQVALVVIASFLAHMMTKKNPDDEPPKDDTKKPNKNQVDPSNDWNKF